MRAVNGLLNINKPAGMTSHDVVARVRRILKTKRVGHAGTLDPDAMGVLVIAVGQATRLLPHLPLEPKIYVARAAFGAATTTEDASGSMTESADASRLTEADLIAALPGFLGEVEQIPPMVSAVHHEGKRLYELARAGITVEREPRQVTIHSITLTDFTPGEQAEATLAVSCGGGTYIRTLCADLGKAVGLPAHMKTLVREAVGGFTLNNAITLETLADPESTTALLPMEAALGVPAIEVSDEQSVALTQGRAIEVESTAGEIALVYQSHLLALAKFDAETGTAHPFKVFPLQAEDK